MKNISGMRNKYDNQREMRRGEGIKRKNSKGENKKDNRRIER